MASIAVIASSRRRRRGGGGGQYLQVIPASTSGAAGATNQLQVLLQPGATDITSRCVFSSSNIAIATIDAPTLTSISPATITQGTNASYTFTGTNVKGNETIAGLPTGVSASAYSYTSTTVVCTLTATGSATVGADTGVYLACDRGNSGTQTLTVNSSSSLPMAGLVRRYVASSGTNTTTDGAAITSWVDAIAGKTLSVVGTPGLLYVANAANGAPGIRATNTPGGFAESAFDAAINTTDTTIVLISSIAGVPSGYPNPLNLSTGHTGILVEYAASFALNLYSGNSGTSWNNPAAYTTTAGTLHCLVITASGTTGQTALYVDGVQIGTTVSGTYTKNLSAVLGLFGQLAGDSALIGTICEALIYDHVFSGTERTGAHNYSVSTYATP